jgi:hypothetical protein
MNQKQIQKLIPPAAPIVILALIGLLLLSALLYYKAVRAQRYLEPSLALVQPGIEFAHKIRLLFKEEFGTDNVKGVLLVGNSVFIDNSLIYSDPDDLKTVDNVFLAKVSSVFLSILEDKEMRSHFDLVLISSRIHFSYKVEENRSRRIKGQLIAGSVVDAMYKVEPDLMKYYGIFAPTAVPDKPHKTYNWVEFRIVPNERVHIEMMKGLEKYFF